MTTGLTMAVKIDKKITGYSVVNENEQKNQTEKTEEAASKSPKKTTLIKQRRKDLLWGATVKIKTPDCNIYAAINHDEAFKPMELFLNSSHLESMEWVALATRLASAMLKSSDPEINTLAFVAKEFIKTESPRQYLGKVLDSKKGQMHNGVIPHIGKNLLALDKRLVAKTKEEIPVPIKDAPIADTSTGTCPECHSDHTTLMDNCLTCLECGYSKCG